MWQLAVDVGTRSTKAARALEGTAAPAAIAGRPTMPSAVLLHRDRGLLAGWEALDRGAVAPDRLEQAPRRWLANGSSLTVGGTVVPVVDALAAVLAVVVADAVAVVGTPPDELALTHPAGWPETRLALLRAAGQATGISDVRLVPEPVAAVIGALPGLPVGSLVGVYDLGAGTLGTSVVEVSAEGLRPLGRPGGHERMGGDVFDARLRHLVGQRLSAAEPGAWDELDAGGDLRWQRARLSLDQQVRQAREQLSTAALVQVPIPMTGRFVPVGREELEARIGREVDQAAEALHRSVVEAGVDPARLDHVLVVGGTARTPLVQWSLLTRFGERVVFAPEPEHVVAVGAARTVAALRGAAVAGTPSPTAPVAPRPAGAGGVGAPTALPVPPPGAEGRAVQHPPPPVPPRSGDAGPAASATGRRAPLGAVAAAVAVAAVVALLLLLLLRS